VACQRAPHASTGKSGRSRHDGGSARSTTIVLLVIRPFKRTANEMLAVLLSYRLSGQGEVSTDLSCIPPGRREPSARPIQNKEEERVMGTLFRNLV